MVKMWDLFELFFSENGKSLGLALSADLFKVVKVCGPLGAGNSTLGLRYGRWIDIAIYREMREN